MSLANTSSAARSSSIEPVDEANWIHTVVNDSGVYLPVSCF